MSTVVLRPRRGAARPDLATAKPDVVLIGFQDQGNLGMGYLAASLLEHGLPVELVEFRDPTPSIVERVLAADPLVVGFSLIFQYFVPEYQLLASRLREAGVTAHFTMGGHFPSLCPDEVLRAIPELDSIVRYEGEDTLVELTSALRQGAGWRDIPGLVMLRDGEVVETQARPLLQDLDDLPLPHRPYPAENVLGWGAMPLLASRGCARRCSFCSIHTFYRSAPGKTVRLRSPRAVVDEMRMLHEERGITVFLFQDDDFPVYGKFGRRWTGEMVAALHDAGLVGKVLFKISCRAEYIDPEFFAELRDAGLYLVYMGLESGTEAGLEVLNKDTTPEQNRIAVETLKELGILWEYGFMLFDPSSSFDSVRSNVAFLRSIVGDGSCAAVFCRMLPYGGTPIRDQLEAEGRLRGDVRRPDYDFHDRRLNRYHALLERAVKGYIHGRGLSHELNWAWHETHIMARLVPGVADSVDGYREQLATITAASNHALFDFIDETSRRYEETEDPAVLDPTELEATRVELHEQLLLLRNRFVAQHEAALVEAVPAREELVGPVLMPQIF